MKTACATPTRDRDGAIVDGLVDSETEQRSLLQHAIDIFLRQTCIYSSYFSFNGES